MFCFEGKRASDESAAGAGGLDLEDGADEAGAIVHNAQAHTGRAALEVGEGQTIVLDGKDDFVRAVGEADADAFGLAMFDGISDGLLGDLV